MSNNKFSKIKETLKSKGKQVVSFTKDNAITILGIGGAIGMALLGTGMIYKGSKMIIEALGEVNEKILNGDIIAYKDGEMLSSEEALSLIKQDNIKGIEFEEKIRYRG